MKHAKRGGMRSLFRAIVKGRFGFFHPLDPERDRGQSVAPHFPCTFLFCLCAAPLLAQPPGGFTPEEAIRRMTLADGLEVKLVAAEPDVRQPITVSFDERGRMWVIEYLQYPKPAGLTPVKVDEYLRITFDRVPEPPPKGPKGADNILIFDRPDANGRMQDAKKFVGGLNLAAGMALGYDGVFVMQPPYLLYYADKNRDDVPDGPPDVLLSGFGIEDAHALANSLQFGPDGWLYGAQGSTVKSNVKGVAFEQGIWRYHVRSKVFELFAEGGGNTWGLDFDAQGNAIAGTNYLEVALHQVQGAYYVKNFGKHGELHNPHAFGYFNHIPVDKFVGGHLTTGGIVYQGGALPARYNGAYIAGNPLTNALFWHTFERDGSSFKLTYRGEFLVGNDTWFRPIDALTGPDGAVYVLDWYDKRIVDVDPRDNWDKTNGRIYKVQAAGAKPIAPFDLGRKSSAELVALLGDRNEWFNQMARQLLAERRDAGVYGALRDGVFDHSGRKALESLWALYTSGGFNDAVAMKALNHTNEDVRAWTVRLLGDAKEVSPEMAERLASLARSEPSPVVRNQMACSAKRLSGGAALPVVRGLLHRDEDIRDPQIPLLLWWAVESKATSDVEGVFGLLASAADWQAPIVRQYVVERLARRYAAETSDANFVLCRRLLALAPSAAERDLVLQGLEKAFEGRILSEPPAPLQGTLAEFWSRGSPSPLLARFAARLGNADAMARLRALTGDTGVSEGDRVAALKLLGQAAEPASIQPMLNLLGKGSGESVQTAALAALQSYSDPQVAARVLAAYHGLSERVRVHARALLEARAPSALLLLQAVDAKQIAVKEIPLGEVQKMSRFSAGGIPELLAKHWGRVSAQPKGEDRAMVHTFELVLTDGKRLGPKFAGNPSRGRAVFQKSCAVCHSLFGEGGKFGPDLTAANRRDTQFMVENILYPSLTIRPEFISYNAVLQDGRVLSGYVAESAPDSVTIRDVTDQRTLVPRSEIKSLEASAVSLMPGGLLEAMEPQEVRDLFAYLQGDGPK
ncbi:MAG: hypothetical protein RIQ93_1793 [Verrucomicrobiota bacterium]|jgi:putative membrane-bound dehydrogenase-like protein